MADADAEKAKQHPASAAPKTQPRTIPAQELFQGLNHVLIEHDGEVYRLVKTRNNKLLLQK